MRKRATLRDEDSVGVLGVKKLACCFNASGVFVLWKAREVSDGAVWRKVAVMAVGRRRAKAMATVRDEV